MVDRAVKRCKDKFKNIVYYCLFENKHAIPAESLFSKE